MAQITSNNIRGFKAIVCTPDEYRAVFRESPECCSCESYVRSTQDDTFSKKDKRLFYVAARNRWFCHKCYNDFTTYNYRLSCEDEEEYQNLKRTSKLFDIKP